MRPNFNRALRASAPVGLFTYRAVGRLRRRHLPLSSGKTGGAMSIESYSVRLDRNESSWTVPGRPDMETEQWREVFNFTRVTQNERHGFRPPGTEASTWRRAS